MKTFYLFFRVAERLSDAIELISLHCNNAYFAKRKRHIGQVSSMKCKGNINFHKP